MIGTVSLNTQLVYAYLHVCVGSTFAGNAVPEISRPSAIFRAKSRFDRLFGGLFGQMSDKQQDSW